MIRRALPDEASTLTTIALEAKRYWGYPEHWIKHWESDLTISSDFIRDHHVYVVEVDGEVRGFYALSVSGEKAELEHMWVTPASIGTGIGKELFLDAMEKAAALEVRDVEISADPNAAGFYKRMGATQIGEDDASIDGQSRKLPRLKIEP
ncbi:MAG TPA: GNAT family N-acetyltransferase [Pyrinomonadaceae bacterium]|nr:GNAT family N-acetyltransferase [Pyrinomonadaceae bacterium]